MRGPNDHEQNLLPHVLEARASRLDNARRDLQYDIYYLNYRKVMDEKYPPGSVTVQPARRHPKKTPPTR